MFIGDSGSITRLVWWQRKNVALFLGFATLVACLHILLDLTWLRIPALPLAVFGASLGIFVSFRTNSCYDRWWEGRKLWGKLINVSRHFTLQVQRYMPSDAHEAIREEIIRRHVGYVHVLRCVLRAQSVADDADVQKYVPPDELLAATQSSSPTNYLLKQQMTALVALNDEGVLNDLRLQSMDESIRVMLDIQGGCERIKKTPLPRAYGFISQRMIQWFSAGLPLALVAELGWATIPISALVALGFQLIGETGRVLEDPFTMFWPALPLSALSRTIEINLLDLLGETDLPPATQPNPPNVLM